MDVAPDPASPADFDVRAYRRALGQFATGVTIVTCRTPDGAPHGMTANSFASVSLDPPLVLWSLDKGARNFDAFVKAKRFAFSVLGVDRIDLSNRFAGRGLAPGEDKFAGVSYETGLGDVPLMPDAAAVFECSLENAVEGGDHVILIGRVERFASYDHAVLVFAEGRYGTVAPHPMAREADEAQAALSPNDALLLPLLHRAYARLLDGFSRSLSSEGSSEAQLRLLAILSAGGPRDRDGLLRASLLSETRLDAACQEMAARGDVTIGDAVAATSSGLARLGDLTARAVAAEREGTAMLDDAQVQTMRDLLRRLIGADEPASAG